MNKSLKCKICHSEKLIFFAHTATCRKCGTLLFFPYPEIREEKYLRNQNELIGAEREDSQAASFNWHLNSITRNHFNFSNIALFTLANFDRQKSLCVLDYGGGHGQFALILKSLFPKTETYIVDMVNERLLDEFKPLNKQIKFEDFEENSIRFDYIFMNDVLEHVSEPVNVLNGLREKLNDGGRIFIDTPCQFWLYPLMKILSKKIYTKLLRGTVSYDHQQIWSKNSFYYVIEKAGLRIIKFSFLSEFTYGAEFYLNNMGITNRPIRYIARLFYFLAPFIARNKIMAVVSSDG